MKGPCRSISRADAGQGCELRAVRVILGVWGLRHGAPWGYGLGMDCGSTWMKRNPGEQSCWKNKFCGEHGVGGWVVDTGKSFSNPL